MGPHGIPMSVATDPANQYRFAVDDPTVDYAEKTLTDTREAHEKHYYTDRKRPIPPGFLWRVHLKTDGER